MNITDHIPIGRENAITRDKLSRQTGLPVVCHAVERRLVPQVENTLIEPILPMDLYMKKPWEITTCEEEHLLWPEP